MMAPRWPLNWAQDCPKMVSGWPQGGPRPLLENLTPIGGSSRWPQDGPQEISYVYIPAMGCHPAGCEVGLVIGETKRIMRLACNAASREQHLDVLEAALRRRGNTRRKRAIITAFKHSATLVLMNSSPFTNQRVSMHSNHKTAQLSPQTR